MNAPWPAGVDHLVLDEVDSTNAYVSRLGQDGHRAIWVLAHEQTASRGRRGRAWSFQRGNFAASYLTWPNKPVEDIAQMSFVTALALFDTVAELGASKLALKWPNDLLLNGEKLSGILLETVAHQGRMGLVIGIGVNLKHAPPQSDLEKRALPATTLAKHINDTIPPEAFLNALAPALADWQGRWEQDGFAPIREAWLARAVGLGTPIVARLPNVEHAGVFEDIDESGSLVLRTDKTVMSLPAGDVYFSHQL